MMFNSNNMSTTMRDATTKVWCPNTITMTSSNGNIFRVTGPLYGEFTDQRWISSQRPVTRSFDILFDLGLNKRLSKQSRSLWFKTPSHSLWRHCNVLKCVQIKARSCHEVRCLKLKNCRQCKMAPGRWDTCLAIMNYREQWEMTPEW